MNSVIHVFIDEVFLEAAMSIALEEVLLGWEWEKFHFTKSAIQNGNRKKAQRRLASFQQGKQQSTTDTNPLGAAVPQSMSGVLLSYFSLIPVWSGVAGDGFGSGALAAEIKLFKF